jgi:hypothetical protein
MTGNKNNKIGRPPLIKTKGRRGRKSGVGNNFKELNN